MQDQDRKDGMTRRSMLLGAGKLAVGTAVAGAGGVALAPPARAAVTPPPWPYKKLDPEEVGEIAYQQWYTGLCANAVMTGIFSPLRKSVGEPYASFPIEAFVWGHGGVVGWGTMCGTMLGAAVCTNLICGPGVNKGGEQVVNEVINYYQATELPTYQPKNPKLAVAPATSRSESPLCHVSVGKWMKKTNNGFWSAERKDRCARLAANVAIRTAMYLNEFADGKFQQEHKLPPAAINMTGQRNCFECHGGSIPHVPTKGNPTPDSKT
jgi:hypothetical protein